MNMCARERESHTDNPFNGSASSPSRQQTEPFAASVTVAKPEHCTQRVGAFYELSSEPHANAAAEAGVFHPLFPLHLVQFKKFGFAR